LSNVQVVVIRKEIEDLRRREFIDMVLPTIQVQRTALTQNPAANSVIGSHRVGPGSVFRLLEVAVGVGSFNVAAPAVIALTHTGTPLTPFEQRGTRDLYSFTKTGPSEIRIVYRWDNAPTFGAGTLQWKTTAAATLGSKNHQVAFKGYEYPLAQGVSTV